MYKRLDALSTKEKSIDEMFEEGMHTDSLIPCKVKSKKQGGNDYWTFLTPEDYEKADVVKPDPK